MPNDRSPTTLTVPADFRAPSRPASSEMPAESLPSTEMTPAVRVIDPWKGWVPVSRMP